MQENDVFYMQHAYELAQQAEKNGEVPVGAIIVKDNQIISVGGNSPIIDSDPTAHAEIVAMRTAAKLLGNYRLLDTTLYVTLEPCMMCLGAMIHARIKRLVFGAHDPKAGVVGSVCNLLEDMTLNHEIDYQGGIMEDECGLILKNFFKRRR